MFPVHRRLKVCVATFGLIALAGCNSAPPQTATPAAAPDTRAADEAAIRALDVEWAKAAASKDAAQWASYYADDARLYLPGGLLTEGKPAIKQALSAFLAMPGASLTFSPTKVVVARAGDFAYEEGDFVETANDKHGKPNVEKGKYVVVWQKQADGKWKAVIDAPTASH
jgi:uncharacterized protein (TIGR02246 family)